MQQHVIIYVRGESFESQFCWAACSCQWDKSGWGDATLSPTYYGVLVNAQMVSEPFNKNFNDHVV